MNCQNRYTSLSKVLLLVGGSIVFLSPVSLHADEPVTVKETFEGSYKIENGTYSTKFGSVTFSDGFVFETTLYDIKLIGTIKSDTTYPYLILSGRTCFECCMNTSIFITDPNNSAKVRQTGKDVLPYPGELVFYEDGKLLVKSRAFFGEVLPGVQGGIWYLNTNVGNNKWKKKVFLYEIIGDSTSARYLKELPLIETTLQLVTQKKATEIEGLRLTSEP